MTWGIIGALDMEVELIRSKIDIKQTIPFFNTPLYIGEYYGQKVMVTCSGIGKVNAAICTSSMIREHGAERIVNVGVAGNMSKKLSILDVALSESVAFHDLNGEMFGRFYPGTSVFKADPVLVEKTGEILNTMENLKWQKGLIASGDVFVSEKSVKEDIISRLNPVCVEMEGAAVGEAAYMNNVPFLVIRTMSDNADDEADVSYDDFVERAANRSAEIVLSLIEKFA